MSKWVHRTWRCPHCRKGVFRTYDMAAAALARHDSDGRPYWHPQAGGYCITRATRAEYDARRGAGIWTLEEL